MLTARTKHRRSLDSTRVSTLLECRQWPPEQISERPKLERSDDPNWRVSHEIIYSTIYAYPRNELKKLFITLLRQAKPKCGVRRVAKVIAVVRVSETQTIEEYRFVFEVINDIQQRVGDGRASVDVKALEDGCLLCRPACALAQYKAKKATCL